MKCIIQAMVRGGLETVLERDLNVIPTPGSFVHLDMASLHGQPIASIAMQVASVHHHYTDDPAKDFALVTLGRLG
jgi:hypothetical protein